MSPQGEKLEGPTTTKEQQSPLSPSSLLVQTNIRVKLGFYELRFLKNVA